MRNTLLYLLLAAAAPLSAQFVDVTESKDFIPSTVSPLFGNGISAVDYDGDGDIDLYVCSGRVSSDRLYRNDGGTFTAVEVGLGSTRRSRMALWLDIDGDRDLDLLVAGDCHVDGSNCEETSNLKLYRQDDGQFTEISEEAGLRPYGPKLRKQRVGGLTAADLNGDGYMDFVLVFSNHPIEAFINNGEGVFTEEAEEHGLDIGDFYYWQPFLHDFNDDGYVDLYCNVDFDENKFFLNSPQAQFEEESEETNGNHNFNEMGISLGDFDNDGDFDIYATNAQNYLGRDVYNVLLRHDKTETNEIRFTETARTLGIEEGGFGWGVSLFDYNNDGYLDVAATNGWWDRDPDQTKMWAQNSDGSFTDRSHELGINDMLDGVTMISFDYDRDGDLDVFQTVKGFLEEEVHVRLYENQTPSAEMGHYLVVKPRMDGPNHFAIGSSVAAYVNGVPHSRLIHAGTSFYGQEPAEAFIGLGSATLVDSLAVTWPGGETSWWFNVAVDQSLTVDDAEAVHRPTGLVVESEIDRIRLNWQDMSSNELGFTIQRSTDADFADLDEFVVGPNVTEFEDQTASITATYYYRVNAFNDDHISRFTAPVDVSHVVLSVEQLATVQFYPNPAKGHVAISAKDEIDFVSLVSLDGREIQNIKIQQVTRSSVRIDLDQVSSGIYVIRVNEDVFRLLIH